MPSRPVMRVAAGPSGSGKSVAFPGALDDLDSFNVDDRCAELHGSDQGIPPAVRQRAQQECEEFIRSHVEQGVSFATETTLRSRVAIQQAHEAKAAGFTAVLIYVATDDVEINVERVRLRGLAGGHSAPPERIREIYASSIANLPEALAVFDRVLIFDNTGSEPVLLVEFAAGSLHRRHATPARWLREALIGTRFAAGL